MAEKPANKIGSASSIPRRANHGFHTSVRGGEVELTRPIKDPLLRAAFMRAYRAWERRTAEPTRASRPLYRLFLDQDHTVAVRVWDDDTVELLTRETSDYTWGPPTRLIERDVW